ncbi:hypothetical protein KUCAC02_002619 [Chaenocephalus aceratus]|uniref:Uncharacterized protein n=1 Tax=Chaenocephalus aceratus TaxID=36190 RepID=A0ACB9XVL9_CHAAC|nr:hypothetical protein KUCAC02_002619 [Chaenocephalus aceratus]
MGRKIRMTLPSLEKNLRPKWPNRQIVKQKEKAKQAFYYNRRHGARHLPARQPGDTVYTKLHNEKSWKTPAIVSKECVTPRSYLINTQGGAVLRRNRLHLRAEPTSRPAQHIPLTPAESAVAISQPVSANTPETTTLKPSEVKTPGRVQTTSGRVSKPATRSDL